MVPPSANHPASQILHALNNIPLFRTHAAYKGVVHFPFNNDAP